jgi:hypothetical protein
MEAVLATGRRTGFAESCPVAVESVPIRGPPFRRRGVDLVQTDHTIDTEKES